jgi:DNA-binding response OmpR family regulator
MAGSGSNPNPEKDQPSDSRSPSKPTGSHRHILIVEDNSADVFLVRRALNDAQLDAEVHVVNDGEQAVKVFDKLDVDSAATCPALVILDINLPKKQGREVLQHIRHSRRCSRVLVVAMSTSDSMKDREAMAGLGVDVYFRKPSEVGEFMKLGAIIKNLLAR